MLLGVIAAVESYLRTIFRKLILVDQVCQESVHKRDVSFGAAIHLSKEMLPEAILEKTSFISSDNINNAMRDLLAIKGNLPPELSQATADYVRICHLRHCAVHRFGKLGVNNAIYLGLAKHRNLLEKPLLLNYIALQNAIAIATNFVKTINNFLFNEMLSRVPRNKWTGRYRSDRKLFSIYFELFSDTVSAAGASPDIKQLYKQFISQISRE